jgi:hypothetical protein
VILSLILLSACSLVEPKERIVTEYVALSIPIQERPKAITLHDVHFDVVTKDNIDEFIEENNKTFGSLVFISLTVPDYENLSLNMAELRRYINQQKSIIVFYENSLNVETAK